MTVHTELTPAEAADRLALRELFDAYAHCADRRDAEGQGALRRGTRFERYPRPAPRPSPAMSPAPTQPPDDASPNANRCFAG
jgi:hypothetical protein